MAQGNGRIGVTELLVGLPFPAVAFEVMRLATTPHLFARAIYGGDTCSADDGVARGWVHEVVAADVLMERAIQAAQNLASVPVAIFELTKRHMQTSAIANLERDGDRIDAVVTEIWAAPEATARIRDYVERILKKR
jgi:enoyl-CoA hydratase